MTVDEMPSHSHVQTGNILYWTGSGGDRTLSSGTVVKGISGKSTSNTGGGDAFNITQPYVAVIVWKRTA